MGVIPPTLILPHKGGGDQIFILGGPVKGLRPAAIITGNGAVHLRPAILGGIPSRLPWAGGPYGAGVVCFPVFTQRV